MIIYGSYGNVSVIGLFIGGILPGVAIGASLMGVSYYYARKYGYPRERDGIASAKEVAGAFKKGVWPLGVPLILIGGMIAGLFTATEASMVTVVYTLAITILLYRTIKIRDILPMIRDTGLGSSIPMFCLACAGVYGYLLAFYKVPEYVADTVVSLTTHPDLIMLFIILIYLVIGTFMDGTPAIIILLPITQKLGQVANLHSLHLGLVVCVTIALGLLTPPYGLCTLISCAIGKAKMTDVLRPMLPMFILMLLVVLIMAFCPNLTLFLPRLLVPQMVPAS